MSKSLNVIEIEEIMSLLPHRYPMLLVDRVTDFEHNKWLKAYKNVSINEDIFNGHFPQKPIFPGVMILEALAQASGILGFKSADGISEDLYLYAGIDKARFKRPIVPGDRMDLAIELVKVRRGIWRFNGTASVDGEEACTASFMCARRPANV